MNSIVVRRLMPSDAWEAVADVRRRAFEALEAIDLDCHMDAMPPPSRRLGSMLRPEHCFVALLADCVVGMLVLAETDPHSGVDWLRRPRVCRLLELAVEPAHQRTGIGTALLRTAIWWGQSKRYAFIALTVPEAATHPREFLRRHGFAVKASGPAEAGATAPLILSRPLAQAGQTMLGAWPARHPAEQAIRAKDASARRHRTHE